MISWDLFPVANNLGDSVAFNLESDISERGRLQRTCRGGGLAPSGAEELAIRLFKSLRSVARFTEAGIRDSFGFGRRMPQTQMLRLPKAPRRRGSEISGPVSWPLLSYQLDWRFS